MKSSFNSNANRKRTTRISRVAMLAIATVLCLLATAPSTASAFGNSNNKKVLLKDIQTLTLHQGRMTTGRRTSPVPQLKCVGGNACGDFEPEVVQCTNSGFDGHDVQWRCQADLPDNLRFGEIEVYCEGYAYPDDPFVLKGSCGLEYKLQYTNIRHNDYTNYRGDYSFKNPSFNEWSRRVKRQSWVELIYFGTWCSVVCFILYSFLKNCFQHYREDARNDPPPPYRPSGGNGGGNGGGGGGGWGSGWNNNNDYKPSASSTAEAGGFRPGFWTGVGLGGLGGYMAANRNNRPRETTYAHAGPSSSSSWGSSSYGSYSGGGSATRSSSSSSGSSNMRSATGFGGTRRR
ncbi:hypothetical protein FBU30_005630 [Linnemannia zychae]|nr:hypothetical protein FBU30_005630 [Linnemannia zychae]